MTELENPDRRAAYETLARTRARSVATFAELALIAEAALLGASFPQSIARFANAELTPISPEGYGSFFPSNAGLLALQHGWPSLVLVFVILNTQLARNYGVRLLQLADLYSAMEGANAGLVEYKNPRPPFLARCRDWLLHQNRGVRAKGK